MTTIIEKRLEGMDDYYKELVLDQIERSIAQIELLEDNKPKCERKQPMTFEEKLKERFGILYSQDENDSFSLGTSDFWNNED